MEQFACSLAKSQFFVESGESSLSRAGNIEGKRFFAIFARPWRTLRSKALIRQGRQEAAEGAE
jgi:hypothetical protein